MGNDLGQLRVDDISHGALNVNYRIGLGDSQGRKGPGLGLAELQSSQVNCFSTDVVHRQSGPLRITLVEHKFQAVGQHQRANVGSHLRLPPAQFCRVVSVGHLIRAERRQARRHIRQGCTVGRVARSGGDQGVGREWFAVLPRQRGQTVSRAPGHGGHRGHRGHGRHGSHCGHFAHIDPCFKKANAFNSVGLPHARRRRKAVRAPPCHRGNCRDNPPR